MTLFECPACLSEPFDTTNGAVMHMVNKEDDAHSEFSSKAAAEDALEVVENQEAADDSEGSGESTDSTTSAPEFPESPDGPNVLEADSSRDVDADVLEDVVDSPAPAPQVSTDDSDDDPDDDPDDGAVDDAHGSTGAEVVLLTGVALAGAVAWRSLRRGGSQTTDDGGLEVV